MIYFVGCPDAEAVKIGLFYGCAWTDDGQSAYNRVGTLQVGCPLKLELLAICDGEIADEQALHDRFSADHIRGEWFRLTPELNAHIAQFTKPQRKPRGWYSQARNRVAA